MDAGIDYTSEDVPSRVMELTGGRGVDLVFEHVGGELFQKAVDSLAQNGRLVTCGGHGGEVVPFDIIPFFRGQHTFIGSFVYTVPSSRRFSISPPGVCSSPSWPRRSRSRTCTTRSR